MSSKLFGTLGGIFGFYAGLDNINDYRYPYQRNMFEKTGEVITSTGVGIATGVVFRFVSPVLAIMYVLQNSK